MNSSNSNIMSRERKNTRNMSRRLSEELEKDTWNMLRGLSEELEEETRRLEDALLELSNNERLSPPPTYKKHLETHGYIPNTNPTTRRRRRQRSKSVPLKTRQTSPMVRGGSIRLRPPPIRGTRRRSRSRSPPPKGGRRKKKHT